MHDINVIARRGLTGEIRVWFEFANRWDALRVHGDVVRSLNRLMDFLAWLANSERR